MPVHVKSDFSEDLRQHCIEELRRVDVALPKATDVESLCCAYFNVQRRLVPKQPRRVFQSRPLTARVLPTDQRAALDVIAVACERGDDLTPRLSQRILKAVYDDRNLNDFGFHHLHLGARAEGARFVQGEKFVLHVLVREDAIYFIDVLGHGPESFANQSLVQIVHDEWPEAIKCARAVGAVPGSLDPPALSPKTRDVMRERFTMAVQTSDGTIYTPIGGGIVCSGMSLDVRRQVDHHRTLVHRVGQWAREKADQIRDAIEHDTGQRLAELHLTYLVGDPPSLRETQANVTIPVSVREADVPLTFPELG